MRKEILNSKFYILNPRSKTGFTLIEILIVIGVVSILASITVLVLKPAELLREARDSTRIQDIRNIDKIITLGRTQNSALLSNVVSERLYISLPDTNGVLTDDCRVSGEYPTLPILIGSWQYRCNATSTFLQKTDGAGWLPINFASIAGGAGISALPIDPRNNADDGLYYTFSLNGSGASYSLSTNLQSQKYLAQIANTDGGNATSSFETAPIAWTTTTVPENWYNASWQYRKKNTVQAGQVSGGPHTNFPMLVSTTLDTAKVQTDGDDVLFTSSNGTTKLDHEIESYNSVTGALVAWVEVPSINNGTEVYIYYGNPSASNQENVSGTWSEGGNNNYKMVQHLNESSGTHYDSTSNANNGTPSGGVSQGISTKINGGDSFDGVNDYVNMGDVLDFDVNNAFSICSWLNNAATGGALVTKGQGGDSGHNGYVLDSSGGNNKARFMLREDGDYIYYLTQSSTPSPLTGVWRHACAVYDGSNTISGLKLFVNGAQDYVISGNNGPAGTFLSAYPLYIGRNEGGSYLNGSIDEVRISNTVRSSGWIQTEYNNQNNPGAFMTFSGEEGI